MPCHSAQEPAVEAERLALFATGVRVVKRPPRGRIPPENDQTDPVRAFRGHVPTSVSWAILGSNQ
jgi:hypothetical protein